MTTALRKKLLSLAIRGKLVPQDPADEPASVLLERIRARREANETATPPRGRARRSASDNPPCPKSGAESASADDPAPPFPIPASWEWTTLGDISTIETGTTPPTANSDNFKGDIPFFKPSDLTHGQEVTFAATSLSSKGASFARVFQQNTVLLTCIGATIGKTGLALVSGACNQQINAITPILVDARYLLSVICSEFFEKQIKETASATTLPILNKRKLSSLAAPLPPLAEQKRIVARLEELEALCEEIDEDDAALRDLAEKAKARILDLAIRGALVPQDPADEPASALLSRLGTASDKPPCPKDPPFAIPASWEWTTLGAVCEIARGGSPRPINKYLTTSANGLNWIKIGDAEVGSKYISSVREKIKPEGLRKTRFVRKGDLLLTNSMSFGHPYILKVDGCIHDGWLVLHPHSEDIDKEFLCLFLQSPEVFASFSLAASGGVVQNLNTQKVSQTPFACPPLAEQRRIVEKVEEMFAAIDAMVTT